MSVYKEGYYIIKQILENSKQIYNDACDYGAPVTKGDNMWNRMKQLVDDFGLPETRTVHDYGIGKTVSIHIKLMDEWADGGEEIWLLEYTTINNKCCKYDGYVDVNLIKPIKIHI